MLSITQFWSFMDILCQSKKGRELVILNKYVKMDNLMVEEIYQHIKNSELMDPSVLEIMLIKIGAVAKLVSD